MINGTNDAADVISKDPMHSSFYKAGLNMDKITRQRLYSKILRNHTDYIFSTSAEAQEEKSKLKNSKQLGDSAVVTSYAIDFWLIYKFYTTYKDPRQHSKDFHSVFHQAIGLKRMGYFMMVTIVAMGLRIREIKIRDQICDKYFSHLSLHHL